MKQDPTAKIIGVDIGGSHVAGALFSAGAGSLEAPVRESLDAGAGALSIVQALATLIAKLVASAGGLPVIGIASPGPFNYQQGVCEISGVGGKFHQAFGLHLDQALRDFIPLPAGSGLYFANDAHCFAVGAGHHLNLKGSNALCLTLGTGFGSAFLISGELLKESPLLPPSGALYDQPCGPSIADEFFSTRWFVNAARQKAGLAVDSVRELALLAATEAKLAEIFTSFGAHLASFLDPWLRKFDCDQLVIGGNISRSWNLFGPALQAALEKLGLRPQVHTCPDTEAFIITGAALLAQAEREEGEGRQVPNRRKTSQALLPLHKKQDSPADYELYPAFEISTGKIESGNGSLAAALQKHKTVILEGYTGVDWDCLREGLSAQWRARGIKPLWFDINACLKPRAALAEMLSESLNGNDPVFGKKFPGQLADFFEADKLDLLRPDKNADINIVYGSGAALSGWKGLLVYIEIPKNEILYRMRAGAAANLGFSASRENAQMYKQSYFVDWPVLNRHKQSLLPQLEILVDGQREKEYAWMRGEDFRAALNEMLRHAFRARPWFEAGVWGGQWMKKHLRGLPQNETNYAWSFELITPENGIVLRQADCLLECSFDFLLYYNNVSLLGRAAGRFKTEFPIRFDFLDTFGGDNLSIQCHPRTDYIREKFGENFTQDETYYILDCEAGAQVWLGFQQDINPGEFRQALEQAKQSGQTLDTEKYVRSFPSQKHGLYLIPAGTIHASGKNNLVLEISSTPYIFTFKMYDWQRLDLNGRPRPINIDHAFNNLDFGRKGDWVEAHLLSRPQLLAEGENFRHYTLPTHPDQFYQADRYEFSGTIEIHTKGQCLVAMLVEGSSLEVETGTRRQRFNFAETFVIPAAVEVFRVRAAAGTTARLLTAYVKPEACDGP